MLEGLYILEGNRRNIENPLYIHNRADINTICTEHLLNSIIIVKVIPSLLSNRTYGSPCTYIMMQIEAEGYKS